MHPLGRARILLPQKEVKQLPSTQAFPPTKNPPWRRRKSGWDVANAKHSGFGEVTFPLSHPHCLSYKAEWMLSCTHSPRFSSLVYLASSGLKNVIYKRCVTLRETLAPGLPLSPSLEIPVSSDNGRIMPGQCPGAGQSRQFSEGCYLLRRAPLGIPFPASHPHQFFQAPQWLLLLQEARRFLLTEGWA